MKNLNNTRLHWQYQYYAEHYWDNCDFNDNAMIYTPVFAHRLAQYTRMLFILPLIPSLNTQIFLSKNQKTVTTYINTSFGTQVIVSNKANTLDTMRFLFI